MSLFDTTYTTQSTLTKGVSTIARQQVARMGRTNSYGYGYTPSSKTTTKQQIANVALQYIQTPQGQQALNSAASALVSGVGSLASAVGSGLQRLFGDTSSQGSTTTKITPSDAVIANFSNGTPQSGVFTTSVVSTGLSVSPTNTTMSAGTLTAADPANVAAVADRFGMTTPTNDQQFSFMKTTASTVAKSNLISGTYSSGLMGAMTVASPVIPPPSGVISNELRGVSDWNTEISKFAGGDEGFKLQAANFFTPGLPALADITGKPVTGYNPETRSSLTDIIGAGAARYTGNSYIAPTVTDYASEQNGFNAVFGAAINGGLTAVVQGMAANPRAGVPSTQKIALGSLSSIVGDPYMSNALVDYVGPQNVRSTQQIVYNASRTGSLDSSALTSIGQLATKLVVDEPKVFQRNNSATYGSDKIIWDAPKINGSNKTYTTSVLDAELVKMANGTTYYSTAPSSAGMF